MTNVDAASSGAPRSAMPLVARVFAELADGKFHSGEQLASALGVSRSAVWKAAKALRDLGTTLHAVPNRGYRLAVASEPLDASRIRDGISATLRERVRQLDVAWSIGSTNTALLERANPPAGSCEVMLAEYQLAGRGRRGRTWFAPPGGAICLSLSWTFPQVPRDLGALGLAVGVCVLRALEARSVAGGQLKWPNDVLLGERKLGGILIELRAESGGPACVVIGIGLNVVLGAGLLEKIAETGLPAADLASTGARDLSRNAVASSLIQECVRGLIEFEAGGLRPFIEEWQRADALRGRQVAILASSALDDATRGLARGIDLSGALMVETPDGLRKFVSGEVTVRPVS